MKRREGSAASPPWAALLIPAALVGLALGARAAAARAFTGFTAYRTPFAFAAPPQERTEPLSQRAVLVLMDGLGLEASRSMPFLNELRARGASLECRAGLPSLSMPARAVLMTGAWQEIHGQTTNYDARPLTVEHLFQLVRATGRETALAAGEKTRTLFAPYVTRHAPFDEQPETAPFERYQAVLRRDLAASVDLLRTRPHFAQVELNLVDEAGHGWGSGSPEYARAAALVDEALREVAAAVDLERDTLVATADHGHVPAGGHGGPEPEVMAVPLVMAGAGVRRGATGACAQVDVAPTMAVLLGLPLPAASQGQPLLDALALDGQARRRVLRNVVAQRDAFVTTYVTRVAALSHTAAPAATSDGVGAGPAAGQGEASEGALQARVGAIAAREARAKAGFEQSEARRRWVRAGLAAVLPIALLAALVGLRVATRGEVALAAAFALGGVALYHVLLPAFGLAYSLTAVNKDEWLEPFFLKDMALGAGACAAAALALCVRARRRGAGLWALCRLAWLCAAVFCAAFTLKVAFTYGRQDVFPRWTIPDQFWGMAFYLDVLVLMAVGFTAPALGLLAALARRLPLAPPAPAGAPAR